MQHIIQKQIIDLSFSKRLNTYSIQQQVSDYYFAKIVPLLQEAFDAASTNDEIISIDSLTVDLGILSEKEIEKENWEGKVFKNIAEQLTSLKHASSRRVKVKTKTRSLSISEKWIFYMKHGYLSWNTLEINKQWYDKVLEAFASDADAIAILRNLINENSAAVNRIVSQHGASFLQSLTETLTAKSQDNLSSYIAEISKILASKNAKISFEKKAMNHKLWHQALIFAASGEPDLNSSKIVALLLLTNLSAAQFQTKRVKNFVSKNKISAILTQQETENEEHEGIADTISESNQPAYQWKKKELSDALSKYPGLHLVESTIEWSYRLSYHVDDCFNEDDITGLYKFLNERKLPAKILLLKNNQLDILPLPLNELSEKYNTDAEEGIYLANAGTVLLHPFLPAFFKNLQLIEQENFKDILSHQKALYLLHYLATGNTKPGEHELVIAKVLCSWPLEEPVGNLVNLTEEELNKSNELLLSAIQQWSILKSTSPDGLRESFLQRKGKLFRKNDTLILQVEHSSIDMLLGHLPWNLGIIKLPWMHDILKVEWR